VRYEGRSPSKRLTFSISNAVDGLCLDLPDFGAVVPGTEVAEFRCRTTQDNQLFFLVHRPGTDAVWIVNLASSLCLDVDGFGTGGDDARLTLWYCSDEDDHHWRLDPP
jgi:ricin-type beta-trefoil lectin protein